ncbi:hypothetical protein LWI29_005787 [Acer saccharum]|uniref:Uncharacterized protein n=1 Tax=Acer saccharum TaxID=4024 RepID=A0AA39T538_ACESA|nr:hypothetical protein LWI29_005787 [Acer saccharum]
MVSMALKVLQKREGLTLLHPILRTPLYPILRTLLHPKAGLQPQGRRSRDFVRDLVKYIVMDNLKVMPISSFSIISLLNQYHVNDFSSLEKETVTINFDKGLEMVKASFASDTVLTDVSSESPGTSRRNCDSESILLDFIREATSD